MAAVVHKKILNQIQFLLFCPHQYLYHSSYFSSDASSFGTIAFSIFTWFIIWISFHIFFLSFFCFIAKNNMPAKEKYKKEQHLLVLPASQRCILTKIKSLMYQYANLPFLLLPKHKHSLKHHQKNQVVTQYFLLIMIMIWF